MSIIINLVYNSGSNKLNKLEDLLISLKYLITENNNISINQQINKG